MEAQHYSLRNVGMIALVAAAFGTSIALVNITKWIYVTYNFKYPLWLTWTHQVLSFIVSKLALDVYGLVPEENRKHLNSREQMCRILPISLVGLASLGASNLALVYLFPSFHMMIQNSTPAWTMFFAISLQSKRYNLAGYMTMLPVCLGGALCVLTEKTSFNPLHVGISILAAATRALRANMNEMILVKQGCAS